MPTSPTVIRPGSLPVAVCECHDFWHRWEPTGIAQFTGRCRRNPFPVCAIVKLTTEYLASLAQEHRQAVKVLDGHNEEGRNPATWMDIRYGSAQCVTKALK
jgi:hypothetical protein